ncbi:hypothetical protein [Sphaerisporangium fuscum]|uniref:hypothetical protein n=1 Tax=Sphaerisporangium fuscum TaxID=2835868 RepID=UPI001BDD7F2D|nr:hypothetical protein [Sphaerisporangium fuscum]
MRSTSTMPIPVVDGGPRQQQAWPPPGGPGAQVPGGQVPGGPAAPAPAPPQVPGGPLPRRRPGPAAAAPAAPAAVPAEPPQAAPTSRRRRRPPMPKAAKIGLQFFGAVGLTAAIVGVQWYDALDQYRQKNPPAQVRHVAHGQEAPLENAKWRVLSIGPFAQQQAETPDRVMLQIEVQATGLNADAKYYTSSVPGFYMTDKAGRLWLAQAWKTPEELKVGVPGTFTLVSAVPKALEDQVELVMWANSYQGKNQSGPSLHFDR